MEVIQLQTGVGKFILEKLQSEEEKLQVFGFLP